ncbi:MAG TPA: hypothetical protein VEG37_07685 [Burkholderiales bacterium]|nr:hypothetical protein [Burkholderiales bacterium]
MLRHIVVAFATVFTLALLPATFAADQGTQAAPNKPEKGERHPEMKHALHALERAKGDLEHAAHDFGGHRAKALELTEQAIQEVKAGLAYDKK